MTLSLHVCSCLVLLSPLHVWPQGSGAVPGIELGTSAPTSVISEGDCATQTFLRAATNNFSGRAESKEKEIYKLSIYVICNAHASVLFI